MPVYVLTGTTRGIGLEFVRQLSLGSSSSTTSTPSRTTTPDIIFAGIRSLSTPHPALRSLATNTLPQHSTIHILECDVSSTSSIQSFANNIISTLNDSSNDQQQQRTIDILINSAGINATPEATSLTLTDDSIAQHITINVTGPALLTQFLAEYMTPPSPEASHQAHSVVANITSGLGSFNKATTDPGCTGRCTAYAMSKAALNMLSIHQATDLKDRGVRVVALDPGWVQTDMGGKEAVLSTEESVRGLLGVLEGVRNGREEEEVVVVDRGKARFLQWNREEVAW